MYTVLLFEYIHKTILYVSNSIYIQRQRKILVKISTEFLTLTTWVGMGEGNEVRR